MYYGIALMAYIFTMDYLNGGKLALDCGFTTKELADALYELHGNKLTKEDKEKF